jgi:signal transduction histidine kinase
VSQSTRTAGRPPLSELGVLGERAYAHLTASVVAGLGALGCLSSVLIMLRPDSAPEVRVVPVLLIAVAALVVAATVAVRPHLVPARRISSLLTSATLALGAILLLIGPTLFPWAAIMLVWVAASFPFVTRRRALMHLGLAFAVITVVLAVQDGHWDVLVEWELAVGGIAVAAGLVEWVVSRITSIALDDRAARYQLELANARLEELNRQKREFLATTSHELRTPLNAILGFSEVLGDELFGPLNERQVDYLDEIRSSGRHLLGLIGQALDVAKVESGRLELDVTEVDVAPMLHGAVGLFREEAARRGVELQCEVPALGSVHGDEGKLRQVVVNLLANAVKFTPASGVVRLQARPLRDRIEVSVVDTGPGIAPADHERVFEAYEQAFSSSSGGTGLGLPLARRLVEAHGGHLCLESALGAGSTFTFSLQRRVAANEVHVVEETRTPDAFDTAEARRRNTRVVTATSLFGTLIGLLALLTLGLQHRLPIPGFRVGPLMLVAIPAVGTGLVLRLRPTALNASRFIATYVLFVGIITTAVWFSGPVIGSSIACWYIWGALSLFMLLPRRDALALLPVSGAALALVLARQSGYGLPLLRWELAMGACLGPGLMMAWLVEKLHVLQAAERSARAEVERSWRELEQVSRHKSEFLANMSHELRTPLNAVIGFAEVLNERLFGPLNAKQAEYIGDIVDAGRQLLALIDDILDLAKAEAGRIELVVGDVAITELVRTAIDSHADEASERALSFAVSVDPVVEVVQADAIRLGRAVANLVSNAVKFSPDGARIDVRAGRDNGEVVVAVHDSGPGIAAADQTRIFDEFQQVAPAGLAMPGAGLGLALARTFAELHHGRLEVESEPGEGSTFRLAFPQLATPLPESERAP